MTLLERLKEARDKLKEAQVAHPLARAFSVTWVSAGNLASLLDDAIETLEVHHDAALEAKEYAD